MDVTIECLTYVYVWPNINTLVLYAPLPQTGSQGHPIINQTGFQYG